MNVDPKNAELSELEELLVRFMNNDYKVSLKDIKEEIEKRYDKED